MDILHIYAQGFWHDNATIAGTPEALIMLRSAIDAALENGTGSFSSFVNDGEGYQILVENKTENQIDKMPVPYTDETIFERQAALQQEPPSGYKLVPVEPTGGMLIAGLEAEPHATSQRRIYRAMIAAAPSVERKEDGKNG